MPLVASAQDEEDTTCRNGLFADDPPFQLAQVVGQGRAYFHDDLAGCPDEGNCREKSFVVPGDTVLVSKLRLDYACAFFPNAVGGTAGYIARDRIKILPVDPAPAIERWLGEWSAEGNPELTISRANQGLAVKGIAFWPGPEGAPEHPDIHTGELDGRLATFGNRARYDDGYCTANFTLLGDYLLVGDNSRCGGVNVRFTAVYRRLKG